MKIKRKILRTLIISYQASPVSLCLSIFSRIYSEINSQDTQACDKHLQSFPTENLLQIKKCTNSQDTQASDKEYQ